MIGQPRTQIERRGIRGQALDRLSDPGVQARAAGGRECPIDGLADPIMRQGDAIARPVNSGVEMGLPHFP